MSRFNHWLLESRVLPVRNQLLVGELAIGDSLHQAVPGHGAGKAFLLGQRSPGECAAQATGAAICSDCSLTAICKACPFPEGTVEEIQCAKVLLRKYPSQRGLVRSSKAVGWGNGSLGT